MLVTKKPLLETGYFSGLTKAYLENNELLKPFYHLNFSIPNFEKAILSREFSQAQRDDLYEVLHQQHSSFFTKNPSLESTLNLIKEVNTFTITTGHQICLATGPLYFIYKIASAIHLCRKLKQHYPAYNFVPIYWMATEDHDFEEINHIHLFNKKMSWDIDPKGATGRIPTTGINTFFDEINSILENRIEEISLFEPIRQAYLQNQNLAEATREVVLHLFANEGLMVLDADHKTLKNNFKEIIKKDIFNQISNHQVSSTIEGLVATNLIKEDKIQVKPRAINFFYLTDQFRNRIVYENNLYKVIDTDISFTEEAFKAEIDLYPERFSPNVIMRPLYQEFILPNLCYIGGAGELSYWFELKSTFDAHNVYFPILALRNSFLWVDKNQKEKLASLGIEINDIFESVDVLTIKVLKKLGAMEIQFHEEKHLAHGLFEALKTKINKVDVTLGASVDAELQKLLKSLELLENKANKAQKIKHEISINQIKKIKENLFPGNGLQERYENIIWLNMKFGDDVISKLIHLSNIEENNFNIISL